MRKLPRLVDIIGSDKPKAPVRPHPTSMVAQDGQHFALGEPMPLDMSAVRMSRRRRVLVTHDGTMIVQGESYPIAGVAIAMDERPAVDLRDVTFDGATPSSTRKETR